jgi:excisionase family DNA binding protein
MSTAAEIESELRAALDDAGITIEPAAFTTVVRDALGTMRRTKSAGHAASQLTRAETRELRRGGARPTDNIAAYDRVRGGTVIEMAALLSRALSTADAAVRLNVDRRRIRQLLAERQLLGVRAGRRWRILDVQFVDDGLVPNIGRVVSALPNDLPALAAAIWLTSAEPDLERAGRPHSPIEWLSSGGDVERVRALAHDL